jgi:hypothetical protein
MTRVSGIDDASPPALRGVLRGIRVLRASRNPKGILSGEMIFLPFLFAFHLLRNDLVIMFINTICIAALCMFQD